MTKWKHRLNLIDLNRDAKAETISQKEYLAKVASRIRENDEADKVNADKNCESIAVLLSKDKFDEELDELVGRIEEIANSDDDIDWDVVNELLSDLYDWADSVKCWVASTEGM